MLVLLLQYLLLWYAIVMFFCVHALFFLITYNCILAYFWQLDADLFVGLSILDLFSRLALEIIHVFFLQACV